MTAQDKIARISNLSSEEIALIKSTVAKNTTDIELAYFIKFAESIKLNPFQKEIWCYKNSKNQLVMFTSRDGFLSIAQRDKRWNGLISMEVRENDKLTMNPPLGEIDHVVNWKNRGKIIGAYCLVKPKGCDISTITWADFETYNTGYNVWKSHPAAMIMKVAEVMALKKAFGISGLQSEYDFEIQDDKAYAIDTEQKVSPKDYEYIEKLLSNCSLDVDEVFKVEQELHLLTTDKAQELIEYLKANQLNPVTERGEYSATEANNQLQMKMEDPKS
jgi:phage recombination protein Bet